jgi:hypothetical protein
METPSAAGEVVDAVAHPPRLWTTDEVAVRPCPVPMEHGIYGWHFRVPPAEGLDADRLLYVGIAPSRADSGQTLRSRLVRSHIKGNASGSTLRLTLGCLLGLDLRRTGASGRATFGTEGEKRLSEWMADNARLCWVACPEPWVVETRAIAALNLPLNLSQNSGHPFHARLTALRADAKARARALSIM